MATMPLVAQEPWRHAEQFAKTENDLFKMFQDQAFRAEQADLNRAQQSNLQQNQFGQANAIQSNNFDFQRGMQQDRFDFQRSMAEDFSGAAPQKLVEKMREKMADLMSMGIPQHVAAAMVGNAAKESNIDARIRGDGGASFGEYQFNDNGEAPALRKYAQERGLDVFDPKTQRAFVWAQLQGPYKHVLDKMMATKDPAVAAEIFSREYERPNPKFADNNKRRRYATQAYTLYGVRNPDDAGPKTAQAPAGTSDAPVQSGQQQQQAAATTPNPSGAKTMPDPNKPAVDGTIIEQRGDIIKYRKPDGSIGYKRASA